MAETLKQQVQATGKSVQAVSREAGINQPVLWRFMKGRSDIRLSNADRLAKSLGLELRQKED